MSIRPAWALVGLLACADDPKSAPEVDAADPTVSPSDPDGPSSWDPDPYLPDGTDTAAYSQSEMEAALAIGLETVLTLSPEPLFDAYDGAMRDQEAYCPAYYEVDGNTFWYSSCTTTSGTWYSGYGFDYIYEDVALDESGNLWDMRAVSGAATVRDASGATFHLGGGVQSGSSIGDDGWHVQLNTVQGSFRSDAPDLGETWLGRGVSPYHYAYVGSNPDLDSGDGPARYIFVQSAVGNINAEGLSIDIADLLMATEDVGWPCALEPMATISVRLPTGAWYTVSFDIEDTSRGGWRLTGDCDGCGEVTDNRGDVVGEACIDATPILDWETAPWLD